ncbi:MAG: paraquat-inducible membrane protein A [Thiotrichales bacterium]|nr:MAG: paraquat-inducible membrane protein A [Thiotrichales bacterium]
MENKKLSTYYILHNALVLLLIVTSIVLFYYGVFTPFIEVKKFWIFDNKVSVYSSVLILYNTKNYFLCLVIFVFSLVFPIIKILLIFMIWFFIPAPKMASTWLNVVGHLGKWSMMDVFVVAIAIVAMKFGAVASVQMHFGVIAFALSVVLTKILIIYMHVLLKIMKVRLRKQNDIQLQPDAKTKEQ